MLLSANGPSPSMPYKYAEPTLFSLFGMIISVTPVFPLNIFRPINSIFLGNFNSVSFVPARTPSSNLVTVSGIFILSKPVCANAYSSIFTTVSGISTDIKVLF